MDQWVLVPKEKLCVVQWRS